MTISETTSQTRNSYAGNGIATVYNFTFIVLEEENEVLNRDYTIEVTLSENNIDTIQQEGVDYTVQLGENGLGTVTFTTAPTATQTITFLSSIPRTQSTDYIDIGTDKFPADSHEGTVDKLTLISREQDEAINRAILLPESSNLTGVNIPVSVANADKAIVVNSTGDNLDAKNLADIGAAPVTDYAKTLLDDNNASEAIITLGLTTATHNLKLNDLTVNKKLNTQSNAATISSGAITYTGYYTTISGEGASADTLTTINGGSKGDKILLDQGGQVIIIEDGTGNIQLPFNQDITLVDGASCLELIFDGASWIPTASTSTREQDGIYTGGANTPTITFPVTFPNAVTSIVVTPIGPASVNGLMATIITGSVSTSSFQCEINRHDANPETSGFYWRAKGY